MLRTHLVSVLEKALDGSSKKHKVISNNIANINTPGFKKSEVTFQHALEQALEDKGALKRTHPRHLPERTEPTDAKIVQVKRIDNTSLRTDGNNVDIDIELAELAQNNLYFNSLIQFLSSQLALLQHSITEGRR